MKTIIKNKIEDKGLKIKWIAEQIGISPRTLSDWINYKNIKQVEQFTNLLLILDIPIVEVMEEIYKQKEEEEYIKK